jgi:hypothetical protein
MLPHVVAAIALFRMGALNGEQKNVYELAKAVKCAAASILKGFVSDSVALRNCIKVGSPELESACLGEGEVEGGYMQKSGEGVPDGCSFSLCGSEVSSKVRA